MALSEIDLEKIQQLLTPLQRDIVLIKEDVSGLKEDVAGLKKDVALLKTDVLEIKSTLVEHGRQLTSLRLDVNALKDMFADLHNYVHLEIPLISKRHEEHMVKYHLN